VKSDAFPANCFAVKSNEEVINYVASHPNAIGVISMSWISDREDPTSNSFIEKIKVVGIVDPANVAKPDRPRKPVPAYIFDKSYPFSRTVYAIRTGLKATLGTGFVSHLTGEKGQLIIQKMGMVPATLQVRTVSTK
jgi:phosphate transport system substrate-binding protein